MYSNEQISNDYFDWLYDISFNNEYCKSISYRKLFTALHNKKFTYFIKRDKNRLLDGIDLRLQFAQECGYSNSDIEACFDSNSCSIFEMIVALAIKIENQMSDPDYGDRTNQWIWTMIISLDLGPMSDLHFDKEEVDYKLEKFIHREYRYDGKGGLFTINNADEDVRDIEIWVQAMWYLNENFDFEI